MKTKKKKKKKKNNNGLYPEIYANFDEFLGGTKKQTILVAKSTKNQFLLTNSGVITSFLGVSGLELHFSSTEPVNFFGAQSSLGGAQFSFGGGAQAVILGGFDPGMRPRGAGPDSEETDW